MFNNYSEILYKGDYEHPITITFPAHQYQMAVIGEGGNRHLILKNSTGMVDLWVDIHCAPDEAFIHSIRIDGEPGARFLKYVYDQLQYYTYKIDRSFYHFKISALDRMFSEIYSVMKNDYITRF